MTLLESYLEIIQETDFDRIEEIKRTTRSVISRQAKIKRAIGSLASSAARKKNDPLYKNMVRYKSMYIKAKEQLMRKYAARVRSQARK